jgi:hypothetical protein
LLIPLLFKEKFVGYVRGVLFLVIIFFFSSHGFAQVKLLGKKAMTGEVKIITSVTVRKGEGCTQATARTPYPMTRDDCIALLEYNERFAEREGGAPPVFIGERFVYVRSEYGDGWVFLSLQALRE